MSDWSACGAGASPWAAKRGEGGARRSRGAGRRGLPSRSCVRGRLRPAACARLRCGARRPGLRLKVAGDDTLLATGWPHSAGSCSSALAALGNPGHLRSSPLPKSRTSNPHPPRSAALLTWLGSRQKGALAQASESTVHGVRTGSLRGTRRRAQGPSASSHGDHTCLTITLACASALQCLFPPSEEMTPRDALVSERRQRHASRFAAAKRRRRRHARRA